MKWTAKIRKLATALAIALPACTASAIIMHPTSSPWLRLPDPAYQIKLSPKGNYIAYTNAEGRNLRILNLKTRDVLNVSPQFVSSSFFWSPDGFRLVYREMGKVGSEAIDSLVKVFDSKLKSSVLLSRFEHRTGFLSFDPRDYKFLLMHGTGIHSMHMSFPDVRLARWQLAQKEDFGRWLASQNGILWVSNGGLAMTRMEDDGSPVESFDISPDGKAIAWATTAGFLYSSREGLTPSQLGNGRDPSWHPRQNFLLFAGLHMAGNKATGSDLRVVDHMGRGRWITQTQFSDERWPQWEVDRDGIIFTKDKSTDLYHLDFKP